ncbi:DUF503 domain-containing protein [Geomonas paludis]|uniref:DUF503 domain-containing protein n=2 Tax=Geomonas TaxID=2651583 RepID=A0A6V8MWE3_9BACT|nr:MULTISPECIES: DUF503 domain-containing protein [Geomonas]MBJ6750473.1 DUF503 domain-containing protein [Geomonas anaerohicana]UPU35041.1 DUF503 domain-containing protein [Geomonas paludis]GFO64508.1 hypothetical protein GMPD_24270 [Geomonas paludis]
MHVALLQMRLLLPSRTLKEKRAIVKSVLARARNRFNVACSESALNDQPADAELCFVTVANSATRARQLLQELEYWLVSERPDVQIIDLQVEDL